MSNLTKEQGDKISEALVTIGKILFNTIDGDEQIGSSINGIMDVKDKNSGKVLLIAYEIKSQLKP